jgi:peptide/nickel transport system permease protein
MLDAPLNRIDDVAEAEAVARQGALSRAGDLLWPAVIALLLVLAVTGDALAPYSAAAQDVGSRLLPPFASSPRGVHLLGTDPLGRDLLSNIIAGTRLSLFVGATATLIGLVVGVAIGMAAGYYGGGVDRLAMRLAEAQTAMPMFLVAILFLVVLGPSVFNVVILLPALVWPAFARLVRAETLRLRQTLYVEAAVATGCTGPQILWSHILPNVAPRVAVLTVIEVGHVMLAEAGLSFLGIGVQPPDVTWGLLIARGRPYLAVAWWLVTMPGVALGLGVLAFNMLARRFEISSGSAA